MAKRQFRPTPPEETMVPVWLDIIGYSSKIPAWKSRETGELYTWTTKDLISRLIVLRCWNQESNLQKKSATHEFTDADKIRAHSWGVAL
jgi:hypothetical protein